MGNYLSEPNTKKNAEDGNIHELRFGLCSMQGWRNSMEDAHLAQEVKGVRLFGVFDGHGGEAAAKFAAGELPLRLSAELEESSDIGEALTRSFMQTDERFWVESGHSPRKHATTEEEEEPAEEDQKSTNSESPSGGGFDWGAVEEDAEEEEPSEWRPQVDAKHHDTSGTTAVVVAISPDGRLTCANAGDSRAVLCRNGVAVNLSEDHKPHNPGELARIRKAGSIVEGQRVNGMLAVSRAIGDIDFKQNVKMQLAKQAVTAYPDIRTMELTTEDEFVLVACDGIWDCMSSQQAVDFCRKQLQDLPPGRPTSDVIDKLFTEIICPRDPAAHEGIGCDNMTAILVVLATRGDAPVDAAVAADA
mmetsp:Transcript_3202/g.8200  ORF Transcript_3202/g.8200 Transcript_3202/m.8200 type:complete len:360 (-) Transcript_3202:90-1169(-)